MDFGEIEIGMTAAPKRAGAPCEQCIISARPIPRTPRFLKLWGIPSPSRSSTRLKPAPLDEPGGPIRPIPCTVCPPLACPDEKSARPPASPPLPAWPPAHLTPPQPYDSPTIARVRRRRAKRVVGATVLAV